MDSIVSEAKRLGEIIGNVHWGEVVGFECTAVKQDILQAFEQRYATTVAVF